MSLRDSLEDHKDEIIDLYKSGWSTVKLGKKYGYVAGSIYCFLKKYNVETRKRKNYNSTNKYKNKILELWNNGDSVYSISKQLGIEKSSVRAAMNKWGIDTSRYKRNKDDRFVEDYKQEIITMYEDGLSTRQIGKKFKFSSVSIATNLNKWGIELRKRKYEIDETFFEKIDTEEKAYFYGWMLSDGSVKRFKGRLEGFCISIQEGDKEILYKLAELINYEGPLYPKGKKKDHHKDMVALEITSKKMAQDLVKLGCPPAKSRILKFPSFDKVPENLIRHMIRGVLSGDGHVPKKRKGTINITGSTDFINGLALFMNKIGLGYTKVYQHHEYTWRLDIGRIEDKLAFLHFLYDDCSIALERKRKLAKEIFGV